VTRSRANSRLHWKLYVRVRFHHGLPPALLLVFIPIRKRLTSREFWLGAIAVAWAIAALTIG
jgi:hypothetical protein